MDIQDLAAYGANVEEGLGRCMGNEAFYLRLVDKVKDDAHFGELSAALAENRLDDAFDAAHSLKGSLGNLAITPIYVPICEITEFLRARTEMDYAPLMQRILGEKEKLCAL